MTDLETQVEALLKTLSFKRYEPDGGLFDEDQVRALLTSLVQEKEAAVARAIVRYTVRGYTAGENADSKSWRERAEAAEARLAAVEQEREALKGLLLRSRLFVCMIAAGKTWKESSLATEVLRDVDAALTPSRRNE